MGWAVLEPAQCSDTLNPPVRGSLAACDARARLTVLLLAFRRWPCRAGGIHGSRLAGRIRSEVPATRACTEVHALDVQDLPGGGSSTTRRSC
jgi:hypothetical protein